MKQAHLVNSVAVIQSITGPNAITDLIISSYGIELEKMLDSAIGKLIL